MIDLNHQAPVDGYEIPDRLREAVHLIMPTDVFPYATNKTRRKDIDHTIPYTTPAHPARPASGTSPPSPASTTGSKPTAAGKSKQPFPGILIWRTPHGQHYLVDHTGTRPITTAA